MMAILENLALKNNIYNTVTSASTLKFIHLSHYVVMRKFEL